MTQYLLVWDDDVHNLVKRAKFIEDELMELVWSAGDDQEVEEAPKEKGPGMVEVKYDPDSGEALPEVRSTNMENTYLVCFTVVIIIALLGAGFREVAIEIAIDHNWLRIMFVLLTPVQVFFTLVRRVCFHD